MNKANTKHWFISPHNLGLFPQSPIFGAEISQESFVPMATGLSNSLKSCFKGAQRALQRGNPPLKQHFVKAKGRKNGWMKRNCKGRKKLKGPNDSSEFKLTLSRWGGE